MTEIKKEDYDQYLNEEYLSVKEAAELLEIGEDELKGLVTKHQIPSHTVAGVFLRLKKKEIEDLKIKWRIERELFPAQTPFFQHETVVTKAGLDRGACWRPSPPTVRIPGAVIKPMLPDRQERVKAAGPRRRRRASATAPPVAATEGPFNGHMQ